MCPRSEPRTAAALPFPRFFRDYGPFFVVPTYAYHCLIEHPIYHNWASFLLVYKYKQIRQIFLVPYLAPFKSSLSQLRGNRKERRWIVPLYDAYARSLNTMDHTQRRMAQKNKTLQKVLTLARRVGVRKAVMTRLTRIWGIFGTPCSPSMQSQQVEKISS
jgi:hypothetical protein